MDLTSVLRNSNRAFQQDNSRIRRNSVQFYKIKYCPFLSEGRCNKGAACAFAHSAEELRAGVSLRKTKICQAWKEGGKCRNDACAFAHGEAELRSTPDFFKTSICKFWLKGHCQLGKRCRHAHGYHEIRQRGSEIKASPLDESIPHNKGSIPFVELYDGVRGKYLKIVMENGEKGNASDKDFTTNNTLRNSSDATTATTSNVGCRNSSTSQQSLFSIFDHMEVEDEFQDLFYDSKPRFAEKAAVQMPHPLPYFQPPYDDLFNCALFGSIWSPLKDETQKLNQQTTTPCISQPLWADAVYGTSELRPTADVNLLPPMFKNHVPTHPTTAPTHLASPPLPSYPNWEHTPHSIDNSSDFLLQLLLQSCTSTHSERTTPTPTLIDPVKCVFNLFA